MKQKNHFWRGALVGALTMLILCGCVSLLRSTGIKEIISDTTLQKLLTIHAYIDAEYLYTDEIDEETVQDAIIKGYVAGLNESYSVYYNKDETTALYESTSGTFGGIGVGIMLNQTTGHITFTKIYKNSPGEVAGFEEGDIVYKVNGEDVSGMTLDAVVSQIRGEIGTEVEITVLRGEDNQEYTGTATRALIEEETVTYELKEEQMGYIQVAGFDDVTCKQFEEALDTLNEQCMQGLIVDLRNNPGGNLSTVVDMVDLILGEGVIVSIKDKNGNNDEYISDKACKLDVPLVVLINGYSASASEIFAGAVKDHKIGTLVGTTSYGKGIVQNIFPFADGTSLKLTCSEYFTPNGTNIHGVGIEPDVGIEYEYDENDPLKDNQLEKAIEVLKKKFID